MGGLPIGDANIDRTNECLTVSETLIKVEDVSKKFCRDFKRSLWYGMQDLGNELLGRRHDGNGELRPDEFWAVEDVSFELKRGECLGLIGRNGAGKTTLLRMLNGLIKPNQGRIEMRGRIVALIALGAGFNPILTGRENIYVNASVLGLSKREIDRKIDEIIDFAEIGEFIDAPVQNYSSGMQVRLGFAVAAAQEPDILLLDEVLAVGDAAFRAKCYHCLSDMLRKSAVILVSHNMDQIGQICSRAVVMQSGKKTCEGNVGECIKQYCCTTETNLSLLESHQYIAPENDLYSVHITETVDYGGYINISISMQSCKYVPEVDVKLTLFSVDEQVVAESYTKNNDSSASLNKGVIVINATSGPFYLKDGVYVVSVALLNRGSNEHIFWGSRFRVIRANGPNLCKANNIVPINYI